MRVRGGLLVLGFSMGCAWTVGGSTGPSDAVRSDTLAVDVGAVDVAPVDVAPVDAAPVDVAPVDAGGPIVASDIARTCLFAVGCGAAPVGTLGACIQSLTRRALAPEVTGEDLWDRLLECAAQPAARATSFSAT